ncbi:MAG: hypothetical protein EBT66_05935 [Bacteroidetes bacterium]|nr:hypothetical protein [Bacteroidota bacterium]
MITVRMRNQGFGYFSQWINVQIGLRTIESQGGIGHQCHPAKFPLFCGIMGEKVSLKSSVKRMQSQGVMGKKELICDNNSMKKRILSLALAFSALFQLRADEGMWPLTLLQKIQDPMQARGLKLSAEDIYSINQASVKDAIVRLMTKQGRMFCTGEVISKQGLFLTNHHCGYGAIQELSTNQDNILKNGFWAANQQAERPANFNIGLLRKIEDVTAQVLAGIAINQDEAARAKILQRKSVSGDVLRGVPRYSFGRYSSRKRWKIWWRNRQLALASSYMRFQHVPHLCQWQQQTRGFQSIKQAFQPKAPLAHQHRWHERRRLCDDHGLSRSYHALYL